MAAVVSHQGPLSLTHSHTLSHYLSHTHAHTHTHTHTLSLSLFEIQLNAGGIVFDPSGSSRGTELLAFGAETCTDPFMAK